MLKRFLIENWKKFTKSEIPKELQVVPITSCLKDYGNDIILIFVNKSTYPKYIFKASRNPAFGYKLKNEFYSLKNLYNNHELSTYIPTPYYLGVYHRNQYFLQEGISGISLFRLIRQKGINKRVQSLINQSIDLLVEIGKTKSSHNPAYCDSKYNYEHVCEIVKKKIAYSSNKKKIDKLIEYQRMFKKKDYNFYVHGDYWQTNILVDYRKVEIRGVIDWEFSNPFGIYPGDIIWFLINLGYCLCLQKEPGASIPHAFKWAFFTSGDHNEVIASCYHKYMTGIGWDTSFFKILLEMTLVEISVRELISYGFHCRMDQIWMELLNYTLTNEDKLCIYKLS